MLGSRMCWQLLLGWALLLGQPVSGDSDAAEEPPLAESEEVVPIAQEPEEPVPESQAAEPVPEAQESEEPVSEFQEPDGWLQLSAESLDKMVGRPLTSEEIQLFLGPSDKELEARAERHRKALESDPDISFSYIIDHFKQMALQHYNQKSNYIYTLYEKGNMKIKKAIGTTLYLKLLLVKTSCTKEEGEALIKRLLHDNYDDDDDSDDESVHNSLPTEKKHCLVPPASEQEIEECTFTLFRDARSHAWNKYVVTNMACVPVERHENNY